MHSKRADLHDLLSKENNKNNNTKEQMDEPSIHHSANIHAQKWFLELCIVEPQLQTALVCESKHAIMRPTPAKSPESVLAANVWKKCGKWC